MNIFNRPKTETCNHAIEFIADQDTPSFHLVASAPRNLESSKNLNFSKQKKSMTEEYELQEVKDNNKDHQAPSQDLNEDLKVVRLNDSQDTILERSYEFMNYGKAF